MAINKKRQSMRDKHAHTNWMGGPSYAPGPMQTLRMAASSCFFGEPQYYHRDKGQSLKSAEYSCGLTDDRLAYLRQTLNAVDPREWREWTPKQIMENAIDRALDYDLVQTLQFAGWLRNIGMIRATPQVIMVRAAMHPNMKGLTLNSNNSPLSEYGPQIIMRADEPATQLAYFLSEYKGKSIPSRLKRAWARALEGFNEYELAKYKMGGREVKTVDVVNLCHATSPAINLLMTGKLPPASTWESHISARGSNKKSWTEAVEKMGHMALLRNLRNLHQHGVSPDLYLKKLVDGAPTGKQLPFRYIAAYKELEKVDAGPRVLDAIEASMEASLNNLPRFSGRVMSLADNSGSTHGTPISEMSSMRVCDIANLMAVITGKVSEEGWAASFGDCLKSMPIRERTSIFDDIHKLEEMAVGQGTEHGIWLFWNQAIKNREHWDTVFIYSDQQAGHGGLYGTSIPQNALWGGGFRTPYIDVPKLINKYRREVNPEVNVFSVQIAGYTDNIMPEFYDRTYIIGGWSGQILNFAADMIGLSRPTQ